MEQERHASHPDFAKMKGLVGRWSETPNAASVAVALPKLFDLFTEKRQLTPTFRIEELLDSSPSKDDEQASMAKKRPLTSHKLLGNEESGATVETAGPFKEPAKGIEAPT